MHEHVPCLSEGMTKIIYQKPLLWPGPIHVIGRGRNLPTAEMLTRCYTEIGTSLPSSFPILGTFEVLETIEKF